MKKIIILIAFSFFAASIVSAQSLETRLSGKILLAVDNKGQAWYVEPDSHTRAYLGRPHDAFRIMRELGLGISEKDYQTFEGQAPDKLLGKILLRVEASGEAYYVNPTDKKLYFLGRPTDAFRIMRELGLGISNVNLNTIPVHVNYKEDLQLSTRADHLVTIYFFHGEGCPHCSREEEFLQKIVNEYDNVIVKKYETWHNADNKAFLSAVKERNNYFSNGVPFTIIGTETILGFGDESGTGARIREVIEKQSIEGSVDTVFPVFSDTYPVKSVIDGDTIDVLIDGEIKRVRIIGMDTPEVVDPRQALECFGEEASERAKEILNGAYIKLEKDETQDEIDKYDRLLRHVILSTGENFAEKMIREGMAREYTYKVASKYQKEYILAEVEAKQAMRGMWAETACDDFVTEDDRIVVNSQSQLEISEIFYDGDEGVNEPDEYIEIKNNGSTISLDGYKLSDKSWKQYDFKNVYLGSGEILRLYTGCGENMNNTLYWCHTSSAIWNNSGDEASLFNPQGELIASYNY